MKKDWNDYLEYLNKRGYVLYISSILLYNLITYRSYLYN